MNDALAATFFGLTTAIAWGFSDFFGRANYRLIPAF